MNMYNELENRKYLKVMLFEKCKCLSILTSDQRNIQHLNTLYVSVISLTKIGLEMKKSKICFYLHFHICAY